MLSVLDLHTHYGESHVLQGVNLEVTKGTVAAVLGRNGVGKTTLCRAIVGFTPARGGRITFSGTELTRLRPHTIHRLGISLVPQGRRIFASLTVRENLAIAVPRGAAGTPWTIEAVYAAFPRLGERAQHRGNQLSGGEQQMLAIARALVANPRLLVMDEPTEGLAPSLVVEVSALIRRLKDAGMTILLIEQNAAFAVQVADRVSVMSKGTIVHSADPMDFWQHHDVKIRYLGVP